VFEVTGESKWEERSLVAMNDLWEHHPFSASASVDTHLAIENKIRHPTNIVTSRRVVDSWVGKAACAARVPKSSASNLFHLSQPTFVEYLISLQLHSIKSQ
jgi:hypothetical protein